MPATADQPKTALIVGASRGLGLGLARELAGRGWRVIATARDRAGAAGLAAAAAAAGGRIEVEEVDIDRPASVDALLRRLAGRRLDLALVNAGVSGPDHRSVERATPEEIGALFHTNAIAPVRMARGLLPLVPEGGTLAFMSSVMGSVAANTAGGHDLYRASKAALNSLTRCFVAQQLGGRKVTVLSLHPGWVRTDMGGPSAAIGVEESVAGLADVIEAPRAPGHHYLDYQGETIPW
jgi:NAD(P)-dependent dehydrogenase (short-subunit alcohol dehydrogenase family)